MMLKLMTLVLVSTLSLANSSVSILKVRGTVKYNGEVISKDSKIEKSGVMKTSKRSFIKIRLNKWGNTIVLGPNSQIDVDLSKDFKKQKFSLVHGAIRWIGKAQKNVKNKKPSGVMYTRTAALGVRGTDFFLKANKLLGETEIVLFDGLVNFENLSDKSDSKLIKKGQWGGLGGRFGNKVKVIGGLPQNVVDHFDKFLKL